MKADCGHPLKWVGLYRQDYDLTTPESMAHPAKASWDLAFKILDHLKELGLLKDQDTVLDPMSGTGRFNLAALAQGHPSVAVELEEKFVKFCQDNKAYAEKKLGRELDWKIIQGDARHLSQLLSERGLVAMSSPPYGIQKTTHASLEAEEGKVYRDKRPGRKGTRWEFTGQKTEDYGSTLGQIGTLPDRPLVAIISPPYSDTLTDQKPLSERTDKTAKRFRKRRPKTYDTTGAGSAGRGYGSTPGQIGALPDR